jgi:uncharacterized membrane protein YccF (DUF307 family)
MESFWFVIEHWLLNMTTNILFLYIPLPLQVYRQFYYTLTPLSNDPIQQYLVESHQSRVKGTEGFLYPIIFV